MCSGGVSLGLERGTEPLVGLLPPSLNKSHHLPVAFLG